MKRELSSLCPDLTNLTRCRYGRILNRIKEDLDERSSNTVMLILQWVACSFRIPKAYEIRDGIVFHTRGQALDEHTKIRNGFGFFDLCLPLLEEDPKHAIDFVHHSAKD
jgi:hypothetical protein